MILALCAGVTQAVWPIPSSYESGDGVLWIDQSVNIKYNGVAQVSRDSRHASMCWASIDDS